jgi:hypothetical protein
MDGVVREFSEALNREITYSDISPEKWEQGLKMYRLPEHLMGHLLTMGALHRAGRYDRQADGVQRLTGRRWASGNLCRFTRSSSAAAAPKRRSASRARLLSLLGDLFQMARDPGGIVKNCSRFQPQY